MVTKSRLLVGALAALASVAASVPAAAGGFWGGRVGYGYGYGAPYGGYGRSTVVIRSGPGFYGNPYGYGYRGYGYGVPRYGYGYGYRPHYRDRGVDVGSLLLGGLIVGGIAAAVSASRNPAPPPPRYSDPAPRPSYGYGAGYGNYGGTYGAGGYGTTTIAAPQGDAVGLCSQAAVAQAGPGALVRTVSTTGSDAQLTWVQGQVEAQGYNGWRVRDFSCGAGAGAVQAFRFLG